MTILEDLFLESNSITEVSSKLKRFKSIGYNEIPTVRSRVNIDDVLYWLRICYRNYYELEDALRFVLNKINDKSC